MKRKLDLVEEEDHESEHAKSESSGDESEDEEPRIKGVLSHLSRACLLYTSPSPRDGLLSRMPSSA